MEDNKIVVIPTVPLDRELLDHIDEFDIDGHASVKRMVIQENTDFELLHKKIPTWGEFVSGKMEKRGIKKKGRL
jgi:hypothetical protein